MTEQLPSKVEFDESQQVAPAKTVLVPKGVTIGLAIFAVVLGLAGFGFRLVFGETLSDILPNILLTGTIFWVLIPCLFMLGAKVVNRFSGRPPIQMWNALTLGLLSSCVGMLWMMSVYS
jgi:hypothetical protein